MKTKCCVLALLATLSVMVPALYAGENKLTLSWDTQFRTEYLGKIGVVFNEDPLMVNDINASYGDFSFGIWTSTALGGDRYGSTFGDEWDVYATWGHTYNWIRVQAIASYFMIKNLGDVRDDIWIVEPEVSFPKVPLVQPYVAVRAFNQVTSRAPEDGWFMWAGLRRSQPLGFRLGVEKESTLKFDFMTAYSDGALHRTPGWVFARITATLPIQISGRLTITPSILWQTPIGGQENNPLTYTTHDEVVGTLSFRWTF